MTMLNLHNLTDLDIRISCSNSIDFYSTLMKFKELKKIKVTSHINTIFSIANIIHVDNTELLPHELILHLIRNNNNVTNYQITIDSFEYFKGLMNYFNINKELDIINRINAVYQKGEYKSHSLFSCEIRSVDY